MVCLAACARQAPDARDKRLAVPRQGRRGTARISAITVCQNGIQSSAAQARALTWAAVDARQCCCESPSLRAVAAVPSVAAAPHRTRNSLLQVRDFL